MTFDQKIVSTILFVFVHIQVFITARESLVATFTYNVITITVQLTTIQSHVTLYGSHGEKIARIGDFSNGVQNMRLAKDIGLLIPIIHSIYLWRINQYD